MKRLEERELTIDPQRVLRLSSLLTTCDAVSAGAGAAMLPQSIIENLLEKGI